MAGVNNSGFWGPYNDAYSLIDGTMPRLYAMKRVVNRDGYRAIRALMNTLIGAAPGSNATAVHSRISHINQTIDTGISDPGLSRVVSITDINRNTTAADVTALKAIVTAVTVRPTPYVRDLSGNGGPALT